MAEMWVSKPELHQRCKVRIFKGRVDDPNPWLLVFPASPTIESKRKAVRYPAWNIAWFVAGAIQDKRNRNE